MKSRIIIAVILLAGAVHAADLTHQLTLTLDKGGAQSVIQASKGISLSVVGFLDTLATVTTNESQYSFGSITNPAVVYLKNLTTDTNLVVSAGSTQGVYAVSFKMGESWAYRLGGSTNLFLKSNTNSTLVRVAAFPN
jgi:hypothetical protein